MLRSAVLIVALQAGPALGTKWDFSSGLQGWQVRQRTPSLGFQPPIDVVAADGRLRFALQLQDHRLPLLLSPRLNLESDRFSRAKVRLRLPGSPGTDCTVALTWTNSHNEQHPGQDPKPRGKSRFALLVETVLSDSWTDVEFDLTREELVWDENLTDLRVAVGRCSGLPESDAARFLEIEEIELVDRFRDRGGTLPGTAPPCTGGALFAESRFLPLDQEGIGEPHGPRRSPSGISDLDGDGDFDLLLPWQSAVDRSMGFLQVENQEDGRFAVSDWFPPARSEERFYLRFGGAGDLNQDGVADILFSIGGLGLWLSNLGSGRYDEVSLSTDPDETPLAVADYNGDGREDVWFSWLWETGPRPVGGLSILLAGPGGQVTEGPRFQEPGFLVHSVKDVDGNGRLDVVWVQPRAAAKDSMRVRISRDLALLGTGEPLSLVVPVDSSQGLLDDVSDMDGDGDLDLLFLAERLTNWYPVRYPGLKWAVNDGSGRLEMTPWVDSEIQTVSSVRSWDLNGDRIPDPVVVNRNLYSGRSVIVYEGQRGALPVIEGCYRLKGEGGQAWAGDLDEDGDLDLVVTDEGYRGGGVHILYNQRRRPEPGTGQEP